MNAYIWFQLRLVQGLSPRRSLMDKNNIFVVLGFAVVGLMLYNTYLQSNIIEELSQQSAVIASMKGSIGAGSGGVALSASQGTGTAAQAEDPTAMLMKEIIPRGVPEGYGNELSVSFEEPVAGLSVLANLDRSIQFSAMSPEEQIRYTDVGTSISCEYCCGAESITFEDGRAACGCEHSYAMRGLAKYLITEHPELSNDEVLQELTNWKTLFFPKQTIQKAIQLQAENQGITVTNLNALPDMVGGC